MFYKLYLSRWLWLIAFALFAISSCKTATPPPANSVSPSHPTQRPYKIDGKWYYPIPHAHGFTQKGKASWYGKKFHGRKTSNGETYNMYGMTAAHKTLPMNTIVKVTNQKTGKSIDVRVNDRGPFVATRIIDLSYTAAKKLDIVGPGTAPVTVEAIATGKKPTKGRSAEEMLTTGNFTVQVGAFADRQNASRLKSKLSAGFSNAHVSPVTVDGKQFYRVRVGLFSKLSDAEAFERQLAKGDFPRAMAIAED